MELYGLKDKEGREYKFIEYEFGKWDAVAIYPKTKPEFKEGDWVVHKAHRSIGRILDMEKYTFRIDLTGRISDYVLEDANGDCEWRLATEAEITEHLRMIVKEKYLNWSKLKSATYGSEFVYNKGMGTSYDIYRDALYHGGMLLYHKGKWAEIIPEKNKLPIYKETAEEMITDFCNHAHYYRNEKELRRDIKKFLDQYED
jgi:hypothetical protein